MIEIGLRGFSVSKFSVSRIAGNLSCIFVIDFYKIRRKMACLDLQYLPTECLLSQQNILNVLSSDLLYSRLHLLNFCLKKEGNSGVSFFATDQVPDELFHMTGNLVQISCNDFYLKK